jgi:putative photosynthetic complex assembly protein
MSGHAHDNIAPPAALRVAFALVLLSLALVASARLGLWTPDPSAAEVRAASSLAPAAERFLRFEDKDGNVVVTDAGTGERVATIGQENSGFVRGVMRGLARERRMHGEGAAIPFRLALWPDGALTLTDPTTGRVVELNGFVPDNRRAFARFLPAGGA